MKGKEREEPHRAGNWQVLPHPCDQGQHQQWHIRLIGRYPWCNKIRMALCLCSFPRENPCVCMCLAQSCPTLSDPMDCSPPGSSVHGDSPGKNTGAGCHALLQGPNPRIEPRSPALQADSLPSEPPGKPMDTGVGSLSLLQGIFLTQKLNRGLLHCRRILYQLSHQGSPLKTHKASLIMRKTSNKSQ